MPRAPNPFAARVAANQLNRDELARLQAGNFSNPPPSSLPSANPQQSQVQVAAAQAVKKFVEPGDLLFPVGGYKLSPAGQAQLANNIVPKLRNLPPTAKIVVYGYTDNLPVGPALRRQGIPDNLVVSTQQAADVANFLISQGVPAASISATGLGDTRPVASADTPQGRVQNRRIEIMIQAPGG